MGLREQRWSKDLLEKSLLSEQGKEPFCKTKKVCIEIFYIYHTFKVPRKLISRTFRKTKMGNCIFFSAISHNRNSHGGTSLTCNISFQFRKTQKIVSRSLI